MRHLLDNNGLSFGLGLDYSRERFTLDEGLSGCSKSVCRFI